MRTVAGWSNLMQREFPWGTPRLVLGAIHGAVVNATAWPESTADERRYTPVSTHVVGSSMH